MTELRKVAIIMEKEDIAYRQQIVNEYKTDIEKLLRYLPWLEEKAGQNVSEARVVGADLT